MTLDLQVREFSAGTVTTNVDELEAFVTERVKDYAPELYKGDADAAKKDRAELRKGADKIADARKEIVARIMEPFNDLESRLKNLERLMKDGAGALDTIVKVKENAEREERRAVLRSIWDGKNFPFLDFDRIEDKKWSNKTTKLDAVRAEMDALIDRTRAELKTLESFEDAEELKAFYLQTLDLSGALARAQAMKEARERVQAEEAERAEREHDEQIARQLHENTEETMRHEKKERMADLVAEAAEVERVDVDPVMQFTLEFSAPKSVLLALREYMSLNGITYKKIVNGSGRYI